MFRLLHGKFDWKHLMTSGHTNSCNCLQLRIGITVTSYGFLSSGKYCGLQLQGIFLPGYAGRIMLSLCNRQSTRAEETDYFGLLPIANCVFPFAPSGSGRNRLAEPYFADPIPITIKIFRSDLPIRYGNFADFTDFYRSDPLIGTPLVRSRSDL